MASPALLLGHYPFVGPFAYGKHLEHRAEMLAIRQCFTEGRLPSRVLCFTEADDVQQVIRNGRRKREQKAPKGEISEPTFLTQAAGRRTSILRSA